MSKNTIRSANRKATLALKLAKKVAKENKPEFKHFIKAIDQSVSTTGTVVFLTEIPQGTTDDTRVGAEATIKSVALKLYMAQDENSSDTMLRLILFTDNSTDGTLPTITEVLGTNYTTTFFKNPGLRRRFHFLKDNLYSFGDTTMRTFTLYRRLNMTSEWVGSSGLIATASNKHLYLLMLSDEATNTPTVTGHIILKYTDE